MPHQHSGKFSCHRIKTLISALSLLLLSLPAYSFDGVALAYGAGNASVDAYRVAFQWDWPQQWWSNAAWSIKTFGEASVAGWSGKDFPGQPDSLYALAVAPVFRLQHQPTEHFRVAPYVEAAIGIAWLSESEISGRELGLEGQFEDRLGVGLRFGGHNAWDLNLRFMHFSNGFIGTDNDGINIYTLSLGYWFPAKK